MSKDTLGERIKRLAEEEGKIEAIAWEDIKALSSEFALPLKSVELAALESRVLPRRYLRNLGTIGWEGQAKLLRSTVAVIGLGGLGSNVLESLARMGMGRLILVDGDIFVDHNLNRQTLSTEANLNNSKVEAAKARVGIINSAVEVISHDFEATQENLPLLLKGSDIVVDALDSITTRLMLQETARKLSVPMVHGAIGGMIGQVMTILPGDEGLYTLYGRERGPDRGIEVEQGCPAAMPMLIGAIQVQEVIKVLVGIGDPLRCRMLIVDTEAGTMDVIHM